MTSFDEMVTLLLGALLTGCYVAALLQGVLFAQFNHYFNLYRDDTRIMKLVVIGLAILTTLKTVQSFAMLWIEFIQTFNNPIGANNNFFLSWPLQGNPLMVAAAGIYVRIYFCYRLYVISKQWWTAALVAVTDLLGLAFIAVGVHMLAVSKDFAPSPSIFMFYTAHFSVVFAGDLLLSLLTAFFLIRSKKKVLPQTQGFINALIWMTFQTAMPGAICSLVSLIFSTSLVNGLIIAAFNEIIPQLYAVTMMYTLNTRNELRALTRMDTSYVNSTSRTRPQMATRTETDTVARQDVELGHFHGVNVRKEMLTHVNVGFDVNDVFANSTIKERLADRSDRSDVSVVVEP